MRALRFIAGLLVTMGIVLGVSFLSLHPAGASPIITDPSDGPDAPTTGGSSQAAEEAACLGSGGTWLNSTCSTPGNDRTVMGTIRQVVNILVFIVGAVAVLMIVIGGLRYTLAQGDNAAISAAKNTIMYAIIGIIVASAAYGIVNFVLGQLK